MPAWFLIFLAGCFLVAAPETATAGDAPAGRTFGEIGRAIVDDSQNAYDASKAFVLETGQSISEDAREAYEEAKHVGPQMAEDIKESVQQGGGRAPDPTREASPAMEKP